MEPLAFVFGLIFLGSVAGMVRMIVGAVSGGVGAQKGSAAELRDTRDRVRALEVQLVDARGQNEHLQQQLEWHTRLLETQDRLADPWASGTNPRPNHRLDPSRSATGSGA